MKLLNAEIYEYFLLSLWVEQLPLPKILNINSSNLVFRLSYEDHLMQLMSSAMADISTAILFSVTGRTKTMIDAARIARVLRALTP